MSSGKGVVLLTGFGIISLDFIILMKIGFFTDAFFPQPNGVSTSVLDSAKALEKLGHEVIIIAPKYPGYKDRKNVIRLTSLKVYKQPEMRMALTLPEPSLRKVLSIDFDIIHGHSGGPVTLLGWEIARSKNIPYVMTYHTLWSKYTHYFFKGKVLKPKVFERISRISGNRCDLVVAPTERVKDELIKYGIKKQIDVIPTGIELGKFENVKKGFLRKKLGIKEKDKILLYVGRLAKEKSVDFLIRMFQYVQNEEKNCVLVLVGDGPDKKKLTRMIRKFPEGKIFLSGFLKPEDMPQVYSDADLFVFASKTETQGLVVPEALASGLPVVAIKDEAFEYIVKNGENGFLVEPEEKEFAAKVLEVLKGRKYDEYKYNARISVKNYSVEEMAKKLEAIYSSLLLKASNDSINRVMNKNLLYEQFFIIHLFFWLGILFMRSAIFFSYDKFSPYPHLLLANSNLYHSSIGLFLLVLAGVLYLFKRQVSLFVLIMLGLSIGWISDELWVFLSGGALGYSNYWTIGNLFLILSFGILPVFLIKIGRKSDIDFSFSGRNQKFQNPKSPKISVVVPAYNEEDFLENTLKSLLNQTYKDFEMIVVDNNSTDKTVEVARKFGAKVIHEKRKGVAWARQSGFKQAKGEIIATTDADTVVPENWVETMLAGYENKNTVAFGGLNRLYSGPVTARSASRYLSTSFWVIDKILSSGWNLLGSNMSVKKDAFEAIGGFRTDLKLGEDVDLSQRIKAQGKVTLNTNFLVYSSGRRFRTGLLMGVLTYAPSWTMRVFFKQDKFLTFPTIRDENSLFGRLTLLPLVVGVSFLITLFYIFRR